MTGPRDLESLHKMRAAKAVPGARPSLADTELESTLDTLLDTAIKRENQGNSAGTASPVRAPLDVLRDVFMDELIPVVARVNERYTQKGIEVSMDAADFLNGGRGVLIEIVYKDRALRLEGTITNSALAFNEMSRVADRGGIVTGGPSLRHNQLNAKGFGQFLYGRIISLVKSAG